MSSLFNSLFATAAAAQASYMADPNASYLAFGSDAQAAPITAVQGPEGDRIVDTENGRIDVRMCPITVCQSQVPTPARGDRITLASGVIWTVDTIETAAGGQWFLTTVRPVATEITGKDYRNRV